MAANKHINITVQSDNEAFIEKTYALCGEINGIWVGIHHSYKGGGFSCTHLYYGLAICKNQPDEETALEVATKSLSDPSLKLREERSVAAFKRLLGNRGIKFPVNFEEVDHKCI